MHKIKAFSWSKIEKSKILHKSLTNLWVMYTNEHLDLTLIE
ncbi:hypothetical protein HMP0015_0500 [Acinetobacter haemolyticus ATCC 19194]|uniref:Uncharacterized protein n=1 Tax=Acinetobacter haemolyticus ATCC 19194 TaxID=707232 RepID=D4XLA8_ACIHA|nr:hypothetical protein HMP0015_0500 [Acinetobacter haemolyticus ATCC 19194]